MRILIIGGTIFLGRAVVDVAVGEGHFVTLFNRGRHDDDRTDVERLRGDRDGELDALRGRTFDAVVDTSGYVPRVVRQSARLLADATERYLFVSTLSVYRTPVPMAADEDAPLATLDDPTVEEVTGETYGPLKVLCEEAVRDAFGDRAIVVRPGLIVGPRDPTDRFTYWPHRLARGGRVLAPGRPGRLVQAIDVRDLAAWMVRLLTMEASGTLNAVGYPLPFEDALLVCRDALGSDAELVWVPDADLLGAGVTPWSELPLWLPESDPEARGFFQFSNARAVRRGLAFRPMARTAVDTVAWARGRAADHAWRAGLPAEREAEILAAFERSG